MLSALQQVTRPAKPADVRAALDGFVKASAEFAWLGLTDTEGKVLAGANGLLDGVDVSAGNDDNSRRTRPEVHTGSWQTRRGPLPATKVYLERCLFLPHEPSTRRRRAASGESASVREPCAHLPPLAFKLRGRWRTYQFRVERKEFETQRKPTCGMSLCNQSMARLRASVNVQ